MISPCSSNDATWLKFEFSSLRKANAYLRVLAEQSVWAWQYVPRKRLVLSETAIPFRRLIDFHMKMPL